MAYPVVAGATCICTMGTTPAQINPTNQSNIRIGGKPVASTVDVAPMTNVGSFGMCKSMTNPAVAAATAAALGTLTPQPCVPVPAGTWNCPGKVRVAKKPVLTNEGTLKCAYMGDITIKSPGQQTVRV